MGRFRVVVAECRDGTQVCSDRTLYGVSCFVGLFRQAGEAEDMHCLFDPGNAKGSRMRMAECYAEVIPLENLVSKCTQCLPCVTQSNKIHSQDHKMIKCYVEKTSVLAERVNALKDPK